jgi:hypothetical protein
MVDRTASRSPNPHPDRRHTGNPVVGLSAAIWQRPHRNAHD